MKKKIAIYIIVSLLILGFGTYQFFMHRKIVQIEKVAVSNYVKVQMIRQFLTVNFPQQLKAFDQSQKQASPLQDTKTTK